METLVLLLPVLGCLVIGAVMWMMMRQHAPAKHQQHSADLNTQEEINRLRAEIALLRQDWAGEKEPGEPGTTA